MIFHNNKGKKRRNFTGMQIKNFSRYRERLFLLSNLFKKENLTIGAQRSELKKIEKDKMHKDFWMSLSVNLK